MRIMRLAGCQSTTLWSGDAIVVGGTLGGLAAALAVRESGRRVCLLEPGATVGTELSAEWDNYLPVTSLTTHIRELTEEAGAPGGAPLDIVLGTLACDQLINRSGVDAFVKVVPTRITRNGDGVLSGVEVVGKSGRQWVEAAVVIDATPAQNLARQVLGADPVVGDTVVRRCYVAGLDVGANGSDWAVPESLGIMDDRVVARRAAWPGEAVLSVRLPRGNQPDSELPWRTLHALTDAFAWLRQNAAAFESATLVEVAPASAYEHSTPVDSPRMPRGTGLYVLPCSPDPATRISAGSERGASALPAGKPLPEGVQVQADPEESLSVHELSSPGDRDLSPASLPPMDARVHEPRDVVVAGYGTGGTFAAMAAAEQGASVAVLDPCAIPGGIGSAGRIHSYYHGLQGGLQDHLDEKVTGVGAGLSPSVRGYHPVGRAAVLAKAMARDGLDLYPGHIVFGVVRTGRRVTGVLSAAVDGYHLFPCQVSIDGTGDGDLAAAAGAPVTLGREGDGFPQPYSYTPTSVSGTDLRHHNFDAGWVDPTDTVDFSRAHFEGRAAVAERGPYDVDRHFCSLAPIIGLRESRFIKGPLTLTFDDFLEGKTYPDTLCSALAHHDNHAMDYAEESEWSRRHVVMFGLWRYLCHGDVPYRALLTKDVEGILMACRALSVDHDLHQLLRMQRDIQVIGEICGAAAAECVRRGVPPHELPTTDLKELLASRGIQPQAPRKVLDLPAEKLMACLREDGNERGLAMWRLSRMGDVPDWKAFFDQETDEPVRFCGAVAAALAGQATPEVVDTLRSTVRARVAEPQLGVKSPDRYIVAALALAACSAEGVAEMIGDILLNESLGAPEILLLLKGLEQAGQPTAVPVILRFLEANETNDFGVPLWGVGADHPTSFRPQVIIRAVRTLAALGCVDEAPRLIPYLKHPSLLLRRYARRVLREIRRT